MCHSCLIETIKFHKFSLEFCYSSHHRKRTSTKRKLLNPKADPDKAGPCNMKL